MHIPRLSRRSWLGIALLAVLLAYANSFTNGFHFDDFHTVTDNPSVRSLANIPHFFTDATTFSVLPANRTYRPTVSTTLALDYSLGHGYTPVWFHLDTIVLFLLLVVLVAKLAQTLFERTEPSPLTGYLAVIAAAWFGLHPAMAETVNYVIQRGDLYCTLGCVAALVLYARRPAWRRYGLYLLPLVFALLSKPPAAIFPLLLLTYVLLFETAPGEPRLKRAALAIAPSLAVTAAGLALQAKMTPRTFAPSMLSAADYRLTQPFVWLRYFGELFLPIHLNVDSDLGAFSHVNAEALAGLLFFALMIGAIWMAARRAALRPFAFGLLWFVLTQIPTSAYPLSEVENDHRMFFSFAGLIPGIVWALWLLLRRVTASEQLERARPVLVAGVLLLLCGYAWGTRVRNCVWHTEESLWLDDVQKSPHNGRGLMIYGLTQMEQGKYDRALDYFNRALTYTPAYPTLEINLGVVYGAMNQPREAEAHFMRAMALAPNDDQTHSFYARWLVGQGRLREAAEQVKIAHELNPARPLDIAMPAETPAVAAINESLAHYQAGDYNASIAAAQRALTVDPRSAQAWNNIGASFARLGRWNEAAAADRKALELDPTLQIARNNLAEAQSHGNAPAQTAPATTSTAALLNRSLAQYQSGNYQASIDTARTALQLDPHSAEAWNNIAAGYASLRQWDKAIDAAHHAIALRPDFQLAKNNLAWATREKEKSVAGR